LTEERLDDGINHYRTSDRFNAAEKIALEFSELLATEPKRIDTRFHARLREHYSDDEIVELAAFIGMNLGYHTFFGTLAFYPMFSPDGRLVSQEESERLYGDRPVSLAR
jgi:hypothetical protein